LTPAEEERLLAVGEGNAECRGGAGLSTACVSVPSTGSLMTLLDGSKPPMFAMYNSTAAAVAIITAAVTVNTIVDLCFNKQMSTLFVIKLNLSLYSDFHISNCPVGVTLFYVL
jgi:hypothetical protein